MTSENVFSARATAERRMAGGTVVNSALAKMMSELARWRDDGASLIEYAMLVLFIAILVIVALRVTGTQVSSVFNNVATNL